MPTTSRTPRERRPRLGISACLTGLPVRYDGTDKHSSAFFDRIAPYVEVYPLCPESAIGMPTPRPPIDLIQTSSGIIAQGKTDPTLNPTQGLQSLARRTASHTLDGFILTQRSPSCGLESTKVYQDGHLLHSQGTGIFAAALSRRRPDLLLIEDQALMCAPRCFAFLCGLYLHQRMPGDQPELHPLHQLHQLHQDWGYVLAGYSTRDWRTLDDLAQQGDLAGYGEHLQRALKRWIETPISVAQWLQQAHDHLQPRYHMKPDAPLSLTELARWLHQAAGSQTPCPLPFFKDWRIAPSEDRCENHDAVR